MSDQSVERPVPERIEAAVALAQAGDQAVREDLLRRYTPFVLRVTSRACGRYVRLSADDEAAVALAAFNEAINGFDSQRGAGFLAFAETVVRRRLVDYFRRQDRRRREVPLSSLATTEDQTAGTALERVADPAAERALDAVDRRQDIERFRKLLASYGIDFMELARTCPTHENARARAWEVARQVAADAEMLNYLRRRRALPLRALAAQAPASRKTLERQRRYIIALVLMLTEPVGWLGEYVRGATDET